MEKKKQVEVLTFSSGESFWFQWEDDRAFDLLILDIEMGSINGVELAEKVREEKLTFQTEEGVLLLAPSEIWFGEAAGHYCILYVAQREYKVRHPITELLRLLGGQKTFVRCHRSFFVNLQHISAITRTEIVMDDQRRLPISRSAAKAVNEAFIRNYGQDCQ